MRTLLLFCKAESFFGPTSTWTVQNSLDNVDAGRCLTQDCPALLIDLTTGHYTNTGMHSISLWLAFLASVQQGRALECPLVVLNGTCMHCLAYRKPPNFICLYILARAHKNGRLE